MLVRGVRVDAAKEARSGGSLVVEKDNVIERHTDPVGQVFQALDEAQLAQELRYDDAVTASQVTLGSSESQVAGEFATQLEMVHPLAQRTAKHVDVQAQREKATAAEKSGDRRLADAWWAVE